RQHRVGAGDCTRHRPGARWDDWGAIRARFGRAFYGGSTGQPSERAAPASRLVATCQLKDGRRTNDGRRTRTDNWQLATAYPTRHRHVPTIAYFLPQL